MILVDCTLRDGGYYNAWDFPNSLINSYIDAMHASSVNVIELGFRSVNNFGL